MGDYALGSRLQVLIGEETTIGTAYTTLSVLPTNPGVSLALTKDSFTSEEVRSDRQTEDLRHGAKQVGGDLPAPLKYSDFDTPLEGALFGNWTTTTTTTTSTTINITNANQLVYAGGWVGYTAYGYITVSGSSKTANNGVFRIESVTGTTLTIGYGATTTEAAGSEITVAMRSSLPNGTTEHAYTVEVGYADIGQYHQFTGVRFNGWSVSVPPNGMCTNSFSVLGESMVTSTTTLDSSPTAASSNDAMSGIDCGVIYEGGSAIAIVTAVNWDTTNNLNPKFVIGSTSVKTVTAGRFGCTGSLTVLFQNSTMLNKFINETESSLWLVLTDPDSNKMSVDLPRIKYSTGTPTAAGEGNFELTMDFTALRDPNSGHTMILSKAA